MAIAASDLDGDSFVDVVIADANGGTGLYWAQNDHSNGTLPWTLKSITTTQTAFGSPLALQIGPSSSCASSRLLPRTVCHDGVPSACSTHRVCCEPLFVLSAADVDGDAVPDIVTSAQALMWFQNDLCPAGSYSPNGTQPCFPCPAGTRGGVTVAWPVQNCALP